MANAKKKSSTSPYLFLKEEWLSDRDDYPGRSSAQLIFVQCMKTNLDLHSNTKDCCSAYSSGKDVIDRDCCCCGSSFCIGRMSKVLGILGRIQWVFGFVIIIVSVASLLVSYCWCSNSV